MDPDSSPEDFNAFWECVLTAQCYDLRKSGQVFSNQADRNRTALIVEPRSRHRMLEPCIRNCMKALGEGWNLVVFTWDTEYVRSLFPGCSFRIEKTPAPNFTTEEYSAYLMQVGFWKQLEEETIVVFQTDVVFFRSIPDHFLEYDYAGANYFVSRYISKQLGGIQGGFSIRKKSAMIECLQKVVLEEVVPEDVFFTHACERLALHVPPIEERRLLAIEAEYYDAPCAFHGFTHSYHYFPLEHCHALVDNSYLLCSYKSAGLYHVVARHPEDVSQFDPVSVILCNGPEAPTYLTYIIDHYDCLPEVVIFARDKVPESVDLIHIEYYSHNYMEDNLPSGLYKDWLKEYVVKCTVFKVWSGTVFSVKRKYIRSRPLETYKRLLEKLQSHPEEALFIERSWFYVFNCHREL